VGVAGSEHPAGRQCYCATATVAVIKCVWIECRRRSTGFRGCRKT